MYADGSAKTHTSFKIVASWADRREWSHLGDTGRGRCQWGRLTKFDASASISWLQVWKNQEDARPAVERPAFVWLTPQAGYKGLCESRA